MFRLQESVHLENATFSVETVLEDANVSLGLIAWERTAKKIQICLGLPT